MKNENITMLNALDINSTDSTIKVKIVRVWRRMMNEDRNKCYSIEMILMDEEGNKISATCLHKFFLRFEKYLIQDECLFIRRPSLAENRANFRLVSNEHKVTFYFSTSVRKCNAWAGPEHGFLFSDFKSVLGKSSNAEDNTAVGAIIEDTDTNLGSVKRINLKLKDLYDEVVSVTLGVDFALEMNAYMLREDRDKDVVLVIQFGALKVYQEKRTLSNAYHATRLFINSDIADIQSFKKSYLDKFSSATSSSGEQSEQVYLSSDSLCPTEERNEETNDDVYSPDVLNGLKVSGLPNHRLVLKVDVPVMLLRNIDQQNGLCNGTRLQIKTLGKRVIEAEIISGGTIGTRTYIQELVLYHQIKRFHSSSREGNFRFVYVLQ